MTPAEKQNWRKHMDPDAYKAIRGVREHKPTPAQLFQRDVGRLAKLKAARAQLIKLEHLSPENINKAIEDIEKEHFQVLMDAHQRLDELDLRTKEEQAREVI